MLVTRPNRLVLALMLLVATATPAVAGGPFDGVYTTTLSPPIGGVSSFFDVIIENDPTIVVVNLFLDETWTFGVGTLSGNTVQGTLFELNGGTTGTFSVTFNATGFTGSIMDKKGNTATLTGKKLF